MTQTEQLLKLTSGQMQYLIAFFSGLGGQGRAILLILYFSPVYLASVKGQVKGLFPAPGAWHCWLKHLLQNQEWGGGGSQGEARKGVCERTVRHGCSE